MNHHFVVAGLLIALLLIRRRCLGIVHKYPRLEVAVLIVLAIGVAIDVLLY